MSNGLHHFHVRKRIYKNLERFPHPNLLKRLLDKTMYGVAIINPLFLLPQLYVVFVHKNVAGLSLLSWTLLACINLLWTLYAWVHDEIPLFIASATFAIVEFCIVLGILLYR